MRLIGFPSFFPPLLKKDFLFVTSLLMTCEKNNLATSSFSGLFIGMDPMSRHFLFWNDPELNPDLPYAFDLDLEVFLRRLNHY